MKLSFFTVVIALSLPLVSQCDRQKSPDNFYKDGTCSITVHAPFTLVHAKRTAAILRQQSQCRLNTTTIDISTLGKGVLYKETAKTVKGGRKRYAFLSRLLARRVFRKQVTIHIETPDGLTLYKLTPTEALKISGETGYHTIDRKPGPQEKSTPTKALKQIPP